jgi:hypothetical protein
VRPATLGLQGVAAAAPAAAAEADKRAPVPARPAEPRCRTTRRTRPR